MTQSGTTPWVQRFGPLFLGGVRAGLVYLILEPFFPPILWAALLEPGRGEAVSGRMVLSTANWSIGRLGDISRNAIKIGLCLMVLFFFYRDGETIQLQLQKALHYSIGNRSDAYVNVAGRMSRVIVQSALLAALLQGLLAGLGYWISGAQAPALLSIATALASLVPFVGTTLVWGAVAVSFMVFSSCLACLAELRHSA